MSNSDPLAGQIVATDAGWRVPGIANLHSHAFQRAMAPSFHASMPFSTRP